MTNTQGQLRAGFGIGSAAGAVLPSVLLVLLVPTNEYRARLWFLLATSEPDVASRNQRRARYSFVGTRSTRRTEVSTAPAAEPIPKPARNCPCVLVMLWRMGVCLTARA